MHLKTMIFAALSAAVAMSIGGCSLRYSPPEIRGSEFPGLWDALAGNEEADFLYVHGICNHDERDVKEIFVAMARTMGMDLKNDLKEEAIGRYGGQFYRATLSGSGRTIHAYAIVWSPVTKRAKQSLCYDATGGNHVCDGIPAADVGHRAILNRDLKRLLLDECLADAVIYAGSEGHKAIEETAEHGLLHAMGREDDAYCRLPKAEGSPGIMATPLIIYTESLGSKILYDALKEAADPCRKTMFSAWMKRPVQVFMGANQLPIMALAEEGAVQSLVSSAREAPMAIQPLLDFVRRTARLSPGGLVDVGPRTVVAFSDPNDLLSFTLKSYTGKVCDVEFIDVLVSNSREWLWTAESPYPAHTAYRTNEDVKRLIACGSRARDSPCPPIPPLPKP